VKKISFRKPQSGSKSKIDLSSFYPVDPTQLPKELAGV